MKEKQKKQFIIMGILLLVLILAWYMVLFGPLSGQKNTTAASESTPIETETTVREQNNTTSSAKTGVDESAQTPIPTAEEVDELIKKARKHLEEAQNTNMAQGSTGNLDVQTKDIQTKEEILSDMSLQLNAILWDKENPMAIINGRVVQKNDAVGKGISVSQIEPTFVILEINYWENENTIRLSLKPE